MSPTESTDAPGTAVGPAGTQALVVHSDLRCPWARVAVHRLLAAADRRGATGTLTIDHRWFPVGEGDDPVDPAELDRELAAVAPLLPDVGWATWSDADVAFPTSTRRAAAWVQAAKAASPQASMTLDLALRDALFADARDIADDAVIEAIAADVPDLDVPLVQAELASGRPDIELDRHAEVAASGAVELSPTIVAAERSSWANPGIELDVDDHGTVQVRSDDPAVHDEILETFLTTRHYD